MNYFNKFKIIAQYYHPVVSCMENIYEIPDNSDIPKYKQLERLIVSDIEAGIFKLGERIPSINETAFEYLLSRDTVEKTYHILKQKGIIKSVPGKGFYVCHTDISNTLRICLLFNKLSNYKKSTYESFVNTIGKNAHVDLHIYHYNLKIFERIVTNHLNDYDYFVIIPHFLPGTVGIEEVIKKIPKEKVLIIDKKINQLFEHYPVVYQDFEKDIFSALEKCNDLLRKYKQLNLLFPLKRYFSKEINIGFVRFCKSYNYPFKVIDCIEDEDIYKNNAYVIISDDDLVYFIQECQKRNYRLGKDVGILSYNELKFKEILAGGISTISTNHEKIGEYAAKIILQKKKEKLKVPFEFNKRNSL